MEERIEISKLQCAWFNLIGGVKLKEEANIVFGAKIEPEETIRSTLIPN